MTNVAGSGALAAKELKSESSAARTLPTPPAGPPPERSHVRASIKHAGTYSAMRADRTRGMRRASGEMLQNPKAKRDAADALGEAVEPALVNAFWQNSPKVCNIELPECRGISLSQLFRVIEFCQEQIVNWPTGVTGGHVDENSLNLYHVNACVILPSTKVDKCSFVELLALEPQPATCFVSHWWGEVHRDFLACLEAYADLQKMHRCRSHFWVCAFANRQHILANDISVDPEKSSFYRALRFTCFNVIVVLNSNHGEQRSYEHEAIPFSRSWCAFEISKCLDQPGSQISFATWAETVQILVQDLTALETDLEKSCMGEGLRAKVAREANFPSSIALLGLTTKLELATASMEEDRIRILNSLAGRPEEELDLPPPAEHASFERTNRRLNSRFAQAFLRLAASDVSGDLANAVYKALQADLDCTRLDFRLGGRSSAEEDDKEVAFAMSCVSNSVREVSVNFAGSQISDSTLHALASSIPTSTMGLEVNLTDCNHITDVGLKTLVSVLGKRECHLAKLMLKLSGSGISKSIQDKALTLGESFQAWLDACRSDLEKEEEEEDDFSFMLSDFHIITDKAEIHPVRENQRRWLQNMVENGGTYSQDYGAAFSFKQVLHHDRRVVLMFQGRSSLKASQYILQSKELAEELLSELKKNPKLFHGEERPSKEIVGNH